ncbi:MAG: transposase [Chlamydiae bacterium]|nr:transposase [Chlamydiota bacterium]
MFVIEMIEYATFMYLRALSFNNILAILRAWYKKNVLSKNILIDHIEQLASRLPDNQEVSSWLKVKRSGYFALDGTWLKYRGKDIVLLILFDVQTLDVVAWRVALEESEASYQKLIDLAKEEIKACIKGFFCDGDPGLLKALKKNFPRKRIQLCVFHKYSRVGQVIPFVRARTEIDKEIKRLTEKILFAVSKEEAITGLYELQRYAKDHQSHKKLQEVIGVLKRNFDLLLTHFDDPKMSPYNNVLEGFNHILKRKLKLMKGFKKPVNINRWLKLILLDWRFHPLVESAFKDRRGKSPLQLAGADLPTIYNWMTFIRKNYLEKPT